MTTAESILEVLKSTNYNYYGIRAVENDEEYNVGDTARESYDWDLENDCSTYYTTGMTAGGTCCIQLDPHRYDEDEMIEEIERVIENAKQYGSKLVLLGSDSDVSNSYSIDPGEARLEDAKVLALI